MRRIATVEEILDNGRIRIKVLPEMETLSSVDLPIADPIMRGDVELNTPHKGDKIVVNVNEEWTCYSYDGTRTIEYKNIDNPYKADFIYHPHDDSKIWHSTDNKEYGIDDGNGTSIILTDGKLSVQTTKDIEVEIKSSGTYTVKNSAQNLKDLIDELIDTISFMKTYGSSASHQVSPDDVSKLNILKQKFGMLLK